MRIGLLSDTHSWLDPKVFDHFSSCDEVWHAGDFGDLQIVKDLKGFKPFRGVFGNIDGQSIRSEVPEVLSFSCEKVPVLMIHIGGATGSYVPEARKHILELKPRLFICGHSHILKVTMDKKYSMLYMNPGAAGKYGFHKVRTILRFEINEDRIENLEAIELGSRSSEV